MASRLKLALLFGAGALLLGCGVPLAAEHRDGARGKAEDDQQLGEPRSLADELEAINDEIFWKEYPLPMLSEEEFIDWYENPDHANRLLDFTKTKRVLMDRHLAEGELPPGYWLATEPPDRDVSEHRLVLNGPKDCFGAAPQWVVATDHDLDVALDHLEEACKQASTVCEEPSAGSTSMRDGAFPRSVPVRVEPIEVKGECLVGDDCKRDSLRIEVKITEENLDDLVDYLRGFDPDEVGERARDRLDGHDAAWVELQRLLPNWVREKANTFPVDGDNETCHGPARQFYRDDLSDVYYYDRSPEAASVMLHDLYCPLDDDARPTFGDYVHWVGKHSARFILTDPESGRDIVFAVNAGGSSPYRFWWADEEFAEFSCKDGTYREVADVWRRCR